MRDEIASIATGDGPMQAYLALPADAGPAPALIVAHEAFGVNDHIRGVCRRLAGEGYVALAPELFHREGRGVVVRYDDVPAAMGHVRALTNPGLERDLAAALAHLRARADVEPRQVGVVGFCMGGFAAFLGACRLDFAASVAFYGGGIARARPHSALEPLLGEAAKVRRPVLCLFGAEDRGIPPEDVEAIRAALARADAFTEVVVYPGAGHGFFCEARTVFHPASAIDASRRMLDWFDTHMAGVS